MAPSGSAQAGRVVGVADPDQRWPRGPPRGRRARPSPSPPSAGRRGTAMTRPPRCSAWTRYIGVGRGRDHGGLARGQEGLRAHVEDLVGAGARDDLVGRDAVDGRGGLDEVPVVAGRVLRQAGLEPALGAAGGRARSRRGGRGVEVEAQHLLDGDAEALRDALVRGLPAVRGGIRRGRHRERARAHRASSRCDVVGEAHLHRVAVRQEALGLGQGADRGSQRRQPLARDPLHLVELAEASRPRAARRRGRGRRSAARGWRPRRSRRPTPGDQRPTKIEPALRMRATAPSRSSTSTDRCSGP